MGYFFEDEGNMKNAGRILTLGIIIFMSGFVFPVTAGALKKSSSCDPANVRISDPERANHYSPDISGNLIFWRDGNGTSKENLIKYNLTTKATDIFPLQTVSSRYHKISGDKLAHIWTDRVYVYDISDEKLLGVISTVKPLYLDIRDDIVTWVSDVDEMDDVYYYDINEQTTTRITNDAFEHEVPRVSGNKIVFERFNNGITGVEVHAYDIKSGDVKLISTPEYTANQNPDISGNRAVYDANQQHIILYDFTTQQRETVISTSQIIEHVRISGNFIVWSQRLSTTVDSHIYAYDMTSQEIIKVTEKGQRVVHMEIFDNRIVWASNYEGAYNIYYAEACSLEQQSHCGDGVKNNSEECDENDGVGKHQECSAQCTLINLPYCGDGIVSDSEECDGSVGIGEHQACAAACTLINLPYCGDGKVQSEIGEACDRSPRNCLTDDLYLGMQDCAADCSAFEACISKHYCGDGIIDGKEECDGSVGVDDHQTCSDQCTLLTNKKSKNKYKDKVKDEKVTICHRTKEKKKKEHTMVVSKRALKVHLAHGDSIGVCGETPPKEEEFCGNGIVNNGEACDGTAGVGENQECSANCTLIDLPYCGDGIVNNDEACDGSAGEHYICLSDCTLEYVPYCGDDIVNNNEQCDGTAGVGNHQECSTNCALVDLPYCGDSIVNNNEACDGMAGVGENQECTTECTLQDIVQPVYSYDLGISEEIHIKPGDTVNLPARILNTGDTPIEFQNFKPKYGSLGTIYNQFETQFNNVVLQPGETFDFILCTLGISPDAKIGDSHYISRGMAVAFPNKTVLVPGHYPNNNLNKITNIIIDNATYMTSLDRYSTAKPSSSLTYNDSIGRTKAYTHGHGCSRSKDSDVNVTRFSGTVLPQDGITPEVR